MTVCALALCAGVALHHLVALVTTAAIRRRTYRKDTQP